MGSCVDYVLLAGSLAFQELTMETLRKFESRDRIWNNFNFFGCDIVSDNVAGLNIDPCIWELTISERSYIDKIDLLPHDGTFEKFRSARADVALVTHT